MQTHYHQIFMEQLTCFIWGTFKCQKGTQILLYFVLANFLLYIPQ